MKLLLFGLLSTFVKAQEIKVNTGSIEQFSNFKSKYVAPRNINVWLPDGYSSHTKYAVLYMHDGQMLFDPSTTWNKQAWNVDDVSGDFLKQKNTQQFIIVGIWNNPEMRHQEYFPEKAFNLLTPEQNESVSSELEKKGKSKNKFVPISNLYLKFIVEELKPFIDKSFYTNPKQSHTFIAGSSMGGLISLYAICEYPTVFGGAACLSTHWTGTYTIQNNPIPDSFANYLKNNLPKPSNHKIYFDYGDLTLDALYKIPQEKIDVIMQEKGFTEKNWMTKFFPGKDHSENSWQERFVIPISFLFQKKL
jgi:predicted alpha/beta superfamily hydrolase